jgi:hypothetical protein
MNVFKLQQNRVDLLELQNPNHFSESEISDGENTQHLPILWWVYR